MKNSQKKYNSVLLIISVVTTILAIYFGTKNQNLSKKLAKKNVIQETKKSNKAEENISKIDSLLFKGEYVGALKMSNELKKELNNFQNDSMLLLRYNLVSEIVAVKKTNTKEISTTTISNDLEESQSSDIAEYTVSNDNDKSSFNQEDIKNEFNSLKKINTDVSNYLTFSTTKGTNLHYIGATKKDKANGYGVAILESGSRYEGQWKNNKRHGKGKFYWNDGEYYEGTYSKDKREGIGVYTWKNGEKYIGEWKNDKRNGHGEFYNKKGKLKTSGIWKDDVLFEQDEKDKKNKISLTKR